MKQYEAVIETIRQLGGIATLGEINQEVFKIEDCEWKSKTPQASIRRIVRHTPGIYRIKPGLYGLESHRKQLEANGYVVETDENRNSVEVQDFNHSYYQGLLLTIGNLNGMKTFCPNQDKNKHFASGKLDDLRSLHEMPHFSYEHFVQRSSTIDVIWFNDRNMPCALYEVEHSTDITNSLQKFVDLQDFNTRMFIVADVVRKNEFNHKYAYTAFKDLYISKRVEFLSYNELGKQYEKIVSCKDIETKII